MADLTNPPILDPRNEATLTTEAKLSAFQRSNGLINSINEGDPLDVLVRTQAYAGAELLYYVNKTPLAFAVKFLGLTGVTQSLGIKATVNLTIRLISARPSPFFLSSGFEVTGSNRTGNYSFYTVEDLTIPTGQTVGTVRAEAKEAGSAYNLSRGLIRSITQPIAFLASAINEEPAQGGLDPESSESAVDRQLAYLRRRAPISALDYEEEAQEVLGRGSRAKAIGLLGMDKATIEKGAVHLFLLSSSGVPANTAEIAKVNAALQSRIQLGTRLYISPIDILNITIEVIAGIEADSIPENVADSLWQVFQEFLDPQQYDPGVAVNNEELGHQLRFATGVKYLEEVFLNEDALPVAMPNNFTLPIAYGMIANLADENGAVYTAYRGNIDFDID